MTRRVLVIVPGFGEPHWEHKMDILKRNYHYLISHPSAEHIQLDFVILQYTPEREFPNDFFQSILADSPTPQRIPFCKVIVSVGIIGANLHKHIPPYLTENHDYVLFLYDDIEFTAPVPWDNLLMILETPTYEIDIVSPCLKDPSMSPWPYMAHNPSLAKKCPNAFIKRSRCELFVYFMKSSTYAAYYKHIDPTNPYMWGMDLILKHVFDLQPALLNDWVALHHYKATGNYHGDAAADAERYLKKYGLTLSQASQLPDVPEVYSVYNSLRSSA